jgi:hypothetical protein
MGGAGASVAGMAMPSIGGIAGSALSGIGMSCPIAA